VAEPASSPRELILLRVLVLIQPPAGAAILPSPDGHDPTRFDHVRKDVAAIEHHRRLQILKTIVARKVVSFFFLSAGGFVL
jgi:hypothetical protein